MAKQFILFDPRTAERKEVSLELLAGMAGRTKEGLRYALKHRSKIRSLNCYLLEEDTPISVFRELLEKEVILDEVWRDIPNSKWQVSSYGRYRAWVENQKRFVHRLPYLRDKTSGAMFGIVINGRKKMCRAQYWVACLFIGEVPEGHIIYHKSGNRADNRVENLGFITRQQLFFKNVIKYHMKPIVKFDEITGEILEEYPSLKVAAGLNYSSPKTIRDSAKENRSAIGFIWKYEEQVADEILYAD